jgi:hypothetical protein
MMSHAALARLRRIQSAKVPPMKRGRRALAVAPSVATVLALGIVVLPSPARADAGAADVLFRAGKDLMAQGKISEACAKFEASYAEDAALGAILNLANCREQEGRIAAAWARWGEAVEKAKKLGDDRAAYAQKRRDALGPRLPYLTIDVTNAVPGLVVYRGQQPIEPGAFGTALPIDPGETTLQVTQGDDVLWQQTLSVAEAQQATVKIDMKKIIDAAPAVKRKRSSGDVHEGGTTSGGAPAPFWGPQRVSGLTVTAVGVVGLGVGFGLGGVALSKKSQVDSNCVSSAKSSTRYCTPAGVQASSSARTFANASQWVLVGSAALTAVGLTVFLTAPSSAGGSELEKRAYLVPVVSPGLTGLVGGGSF